MKDIVVIYHANCPDGFGGAWAAWKKFGDQADYIPTKHEDSILAGLKNKEIYFIDFIYNQFIFKTELIQNLIQENKTVTAIDHHITAQSAIKSIPDHLFDNNHSGAVLAWQYFHPDKPIPKILLYIEDTDLWKFQLSTTKEVSSFLELFDFNFNVWNKLAADLETETGLANAVSRGETILLYEDKIVKKSVENYAEEVKFENYKCLAVNYPNFFASALGHALAKKMPPISIVWSYRRGNNIFSLRSDGTVDVGAIAKKYGGGGHKAAAGFAMSAEKPLPWKIVG